MSNKGTSGANRRRQEEIEEAKRRKKFTIRASVIFAVVVIAAAFAIFIQSNSAKRLFKAVTVTDANGSNIATLTAAEYDYYFIEAYYTYMSSASQSNQYYSMYSQLGMTPEDYGIYEVPTPSSYSALKTEYYDSINGVTWFDYFTTETEDSIKTLYVAYNDAQKSTEFELTAEELQEFENTLAENKKSILEQESSEGVLAYKSIKDYLSKSYGKKINEKLFDKLQLISTTASKYRQFVIEEEAKSYTNEMMQDYYNEHREDYDRYTYMSIQIPVRSLTDEESALEGEELEAKDAEVQTITKEFSEALLQSVLTGAPLPELNIYAPDTADDTAADTESTDDTADTAEAEDETAEDFTVYFDGTAFDDLTDEEKEARVAAAARYVDASKYADINAVIMENIPKSTLSTYTMYVPEDTGSDDTGAADTADDTADDSADSDTAAATLFDFISAAAYDETGEVSPVFLFCEATDGSPTTYYLIYFTSLEDNDYHPVNMRYVAITPDTATAPVQSDFAQKDENGETLKDESGSDIIDTEAYDAAVAKQAADNEQFKADAKARAEALMTEWEAAGVTAEFLENYAEENAEDTLVSGDIVEPYTRYGSNMDQKITDWLYGRNDQGERSPGDHTLIVLDNGTCYLVYYIELDPLTHAELAGDSGLRTQASNDWVNQVTTDYAIKKLWGWRFAEAN